MPDDFFLIERILSLPRWEARLSDGSVVVMDDGRPGTTETAWARLRQQVAAGGPRVVGLDIAFRARTLTPVPDNARGYFFGQALFADFAGSPPTHFFLVGYVPADADLVRVGTWIVPALVPVAQGDRSLTDCTNGLILN